MIPAGSNFLSTAYGVMKTNIKTAFFLDEQKNLQIDNTHYSVLLSCVSLLGTVLPFFAGAFIDRFGVVRVSLIINLAIFLGSVQLSLSAYLNSYGWMISGEVFFGIGSGIMSVIQEAILSKWFRDKNLSVVLGLKLSVTRLVQFVGNIACQPLIAGAGNWAWGFHLSMILCAMSMVINIAFAYMMWRLGYVTATGKQAIEDKADESRRIRWSAPLFFPLVYWVAPWLQLTISSVWSSFEDQSTEYIEFRFSATEINAAYNSSISQAIPFVLAPFLGLIIDRWGQRLSLLPAVGMTLFSLALGTGSVMIITCTALTLPQEFVGTGIGLHKSANNIGTTIINVLAGYLQDHAYHDGDTDYNEDLTEDYAGVMYLYISLSSLAAVLTIFWWILDRTRLKGWLQANRAERQRRLDQNQNISDSSESPIDIPNELLAAVAWAMYFSFALLPVYNNENSDISG
ncbi:hypothetical protein INT43_002040 [Umbelopsis isabellina]|uniref:Lysosomal dipeptide transporter MFSD1 n=1 Tax=Mortierella isabellina TaxID=91625 RepID=A0A8H7PSY4_MORIS|nr:hypothetical protein INT43_002040 [Umbelopsis isabellina]